ncbi:MAG: hypothetical protein O2854_08145 [Chloroflexi bacterium]|nr:hypothetical protein [Chloroflexota bacterium]
MGFVKTRLERIRKSIADWDVGGRSAKGNLVRAIFMLAVAAALVFVEIKLTWGVPSIYPIFIAAGIVLVVLLDTIFQERR